MAHRTILLTGVTGKFGRVFARHFLEAGDTVIGTARTTASLERFNETFDSSKSSFIGIAADFSSEDGIERLIGELTKKSLYPNCLINNARSLDYLMTEENGVVSRGNFTNEFVMDVVVPYELTIRMAKKTGSRLRKVVNIGSQYGCVAANPSLYDKPEIESPIHYSVAKAALVHLTRELAVRLSKRQIQVNCVAFGGVEGRVDNSFKERYAKLCPMERMLTNEEVAGPVDMLLSDFSSVITGQTVMADGGWTLW